MTDWLHNRGEMAEQLRTEAERLKLALEAADTGMWEWDPATGEAAWTDRLWELFGIAPHSQPMTYASWRGIVWPEDLPQAEQAIADATRRGLEFTYEFRVRKPDGSLRSLLSRGRPMGGADGRPTGLYHGIMIDITARRQMEDELRAAEARARARALELDAIMEAMPAITFIAHDPECRSMTSSRVALELLRLTPQANTSLSAPDAERPRTFQTFRGDRELRPEELPVQRAAAAGQPIYGAELDLVFSDGDRRTILGNAVPLLDESRRPRGAIGSFIDITARRQVEAALHAQEARNREILEAIPTIIWSARPDGYIEYCNPGWLSFTGMDREQIQGTGWMAALHPDDVEQTGRAWAEACRRGDIYEVEQRLRCHTGEYHWFLTRATPVRDADGSIRQWYGANTDITARKQAEADLMASEVKYRRIVDTASEGIWILDAGGNTTFANKHLAEMLGYEQGEMQGRSLFAFMDEEARLEAEYHLGKRREGLSETHDFRFRRRDGSDLWAIVSTTPILDDQGGYLGALGMITDITDRKRAEAALRESEERFKRMIDEAPLGIAIVDSLNAKFCLVNPALARITGRSREELERIDWVSITHPDDIQPDKENMAAMNAGKIPGFQLEKRYRHPDGRYFWVNITVAPMYVEDSSKLRHLLMVEDISARKRAEDALRESEARFRQIANSLPQLVWTCAPDGQCDFLSRQWVEYTGAPEAEQLGYGWLERLHPEDRERTAAAWAHAVAAGGDLQVAFRIRDKDGAYRWFDTRATRLKDAAGQTVKWFGSNTDITPLKQAEEARLESESRFRAFMDNAPVIAWAKDDQGRHIYLNRGYETRFGVRLADWQGKADAELWPPEIAATFRQNDLAVMAADRPLEVEEETANPDGSRTAWLNCKFVFEGADGQKCVGGIGLDVTERKRLAERLQQSEKMASLGQLAGGIAHNFNNQLAGVMGFADLLLERLDDETQRRYALNIITASRRCADLAAQLLAFARKGKYLLMPVDVHQLIGEAVAILRQSLDRRIEIRQHLDASQATVQGDPSQLQNLLLNLALNARDAMPAGGQLIFETATVELAEAQAAPLDLRPGRYLQLAVRDTGTGMSAETRQHLFEPFFTTKEPGQGTGLGLASVHGTVTNHGGAITVQSEWGQGSTFTIDLPLHAETPPATTAGAAGAAAPIPRKTQVLLVDDEEMILELGSAMLRALGCEVILCRDGAEAVERYREAWQEIDLVILDVVMPRLGGRETFAVMRAINPAIQAIMASGYNIDGEARKILDDGARAFLQKPFNRAELARKVAEALGGRERC